MKGERLKAKGKRIKVKGDKNLGGWEARRLKKSKKKCMIEKV